MKRLALLFFMLIGPILSFPSESFAAGDLQRMIDALEDGDVLQLEDKTYEGNITISKAIEIIGGKETVIKGDRTGNVISVRSPNVKLKNLTVTDSSISRNSPEEYAAIKVYTDHNVIDGITVKDSYHGIYLSQAHHNTVQNCDITGLGKGEIANQGNGLHIYYSNNNMLKNNEVIQSRDGIYLDYAYDNHIIHNKVSETRYGLHYMYSHRNSFEENTFTFNTGGAAIMESNGTILKNNRFIFNYGHKSFGLLLLSAQDTIIEENTFFLNQRGLYIDQATNSTIRNNQIIQNQIGVEIWASANGQVFTENKIDQNTIPVASLGGQGGHSWSDKEKGNDWGNSFPVLDLDQNGVGDEPITYQSSLHDLIENQELTYLFLKSPAIAVYEKMNQFLNKEKTMFEDPYPLIKKGSSSISSLLVVVLGLLLLLFLFKGRQLLCITFGRNGRKT